mmetsp:Transcript_34583/g.25719  ORF Transcript_34583/g.25719 Transcript_34583/m.25719 type:complete len:202 (-) Transcript_34583:38-643(-)
MIGGIVSISKLWVQDLKFSPDSQTLAVSSHDGKIHIYAIPKLSKVCTLHASRSAVTHLDWSLDGQHLHTNDTSYEVLYYNVPNKKQDTSGASNLCNEVWQTWTLPLGWPVQGIWDPAIDGSDINAVCRSNQPHPDGYHLLASADDFSKVKLYRYPSMMEMSQSLVGKGHSSHVTNVVFSHDDKKLFSLGGNDTCLFQWSIE